MKTTNRNKGKKTEGNVIYKPSYFSVRERIPEDFIEERMSFNELDDYLTNVADYAEEIENTLKDLIEKANNVWDEKEAMELVEYINNIHIKENN